VPLSSEEVDYPLLREVHRASMLDAPDAVSAWRRATLSIPRRPQGPLEPLPPARQACGRGFGETIQRRGSTREFDHTPISAVDLATVLHVATRAIIADVPPGLVDLYLIVNAVEGVEPGAYGYWSDPHALEPLRRGDFRAESAYLCLEQSLGGDAAAVIYFLAPLDAILAAYGNRGYRLANLEAGLAGGRAYLAAYGQGFGASGLTFYDGQVVRFFSPHAAGKDAIFVTALGRSRIRGRSGDAEIPVTSRLTAPVRRTSA
jgi:SagB-type dehydrogenase family enzyme